jgi:hypothetical protein
MKHVKDSTPAEQAANLAALIRGAKPKIITGSSSLSLPPTPAPPDPWPKLAKDMTEAERAAFLTDHKKKFA